MLATLVERAVVGDMTPPENEIKKYDSHSFG